MNPNFNRRKTSMKAAPFWFVWNPSGYNPTHRHDTLGDATREAERLARASHGETFIVLESVCAVCVDNLHTTDMRPDCDPDHDLPF